MIIVFKTLGSYVRRLSCRMLSHIVSRFPAEGCRYNNYLASCLRFFSKKRIVVDEAFRPKAKPKPNAVQLNPYNKIRYVAKQSLLPQSHVLKALCVKEGKYYYLTVELYYYLNYL